MFATQQLCSSSQGNIYRFTGTAIEFHNHKAWEINPKFEAFKL